MTEDGKMKEEGRGRTEDGKLKEEGRGRTKELVWQNVKNVIKKRIIRFRNLGPNEIRPG